MPVTDRLGGPQSPAGDRAAIEKLLTAEQVAEVLQLHPRTVIRMARQGRLPSLRVCGRVRFLASDIASWLAARRTACHDS
jgi:excisionase family DNA binding protein